MPLQLQLQSSMAQTRPSVARGTPAAPRCVAKAQFRRVQSYGTVHELQIQISRGRVQCRCEAAAVQQADTSPQQQEPAVPQSDMWEMDFCSRPLLDERGKKVWELLICDPERKFQYSQYFPNSKINSVEVSSAAGLKGRFLSCDLMQPAESY